MSKIQEAVNKIKSLYADIFSVYNFSLIIVLIATVLCVVFNCPGWRYTTQAYKITNWLFLCTILTFPGVYLVESLPKKMLEEAALIKKIAALIVSGILSVVLTSLSLEQILGLKIKPHINSDRVLAYVFAYCIVCFVVTLFFKHKESEKGFEKYLTSIFVSAVQICIVWVVLAIGFALLALIFDELIVDTNDWMLLPQYLIMGLYVVPMAIGAIHKTSDEINKFFQILIKYVMLILTLAGAAIIYIYMIKIVVLNEIPSNSVFVILTILFFFAIPVGYACTSFEKDSLLQKLAYNMPYIYAPFIILQIYCLGVRIASYGVTPSRYMGIVYIVLELIYVVVYAIRREHISKILIIMAVLSMTTAVIPGINMFDAAKLGYARTVKKYVADKNAFGTPEAQKKLIGAYKYLLDKEGDEYVDKIISMEDQQLISTMSLLTGDYVFKDMKERVFLNSDDSFIPISGYDIIAGFDKTLDRDSIDISNIELDIDGQSIGIYDFTDEVASVVDRAHEQEENTIYGVDHMQISDNVKLVVTYLNINRDKMTGEISYFRVSGHYLEKK